MRSAPGARKEDKKEGEEDEVAREAALSVAAAGFEGVCGCREARCGVKEQRWYMSLDVTWQACTTHRSPLSCGPVLGSLSRRTVMTKSSRVEVIDGFEVALSDCDAFVSGAMVETPW